MPPMSSRHPFFRIFLMLALLLNGLVVAHAAVGHEVMSRALTPMPVTQTMHKDMSVQDHGAVMGMSDCHERAEDMPVADSPDSTPHKGMTCCQGPVCNCSCALQLPVSFSPIAMHSHWQSVQITLAANSYRSIDPSLLLRPPIA